MQQAPAPAGHWHGCVCCADAMADACALYSAGFGFSRYDEKERAVAG
ncbi:hypothetical protein BSIN_3246 [Burkholderia singularis]|uniref:Uncharacterized protein n=1 Tax=Burkholderia singularis TaxID=1503053 RepID=A0A238H467_9BURK|nr:hypothetical protein BSIN_3246 [Burkholderia singularis]